MDPLCKRSVVHDLSKEKVNEDSVDQIKTKVLDTFERLGVSDRFGIVETAKRSHAGGAAFVKNSSFNISYFLGMKYEFSSDENQDTISDEDLEYSADEDSDGEEAELDGNLKYSTDSENPKTD